MGVIEKLRIAAIVLVAVAMFVGFFFFMQASPTLCDGMGYPVCTGDP